MNMNGFTEAWRSFYNSGMYQSVNQKLHDSEKHYKYINGTYTSPQIELYRQIYKDAATADEANQKFVDFVNDWATNKTLGKMSLLDAYSFANKKPETKVPEEKTEDLQTKIAADMASRAQNPVQSNLDEYVALEKLKKGREKDTASGITLEADENMPLSLDILQKKVSEFEAKSGTTRNDSKGSLKKAFEALKKTDPEAYWECAQIAKDIEGGYKRLVKQKPRNKAFEKEWKFIMNYTQSALEGKAFSKYSKDTVDSGEEKKLKQTYDKFMSRKSTILNSPSNELVKTLKDIQSAYENELKWYDFIPDIDSNQSIIDRSETRQNGYEALWNNSCNEFIKRIQGGYNFATAEDAIKAFVSNPAWNVGEIIGTLDDGTDLSWGDFLNSCLEYLGAERLHSADKFGQIAGFVSEGADKVVGTEKTENSVPVQNPSSESTEEKSTVGKVVDIGKKVGNAVGDAVKWGTRAFSGGKE